MSVIFDTMRGFALGNHVWFAEENTEVTIDGNTQKVSASYIPPATWGGWKQIGAVSSVQLEQNIETAVAQGPNPFTLNDIDEMVTKAEYNYNFVVESLEKLGKELLFGTTLDDTTGEGVIGIKPQRRGWVVWSGIDSSNGKLMDGNIWGSLKVTDASTLTSNEFCKPTIQLKQLVSSLNKVKFYH